MKSWQQMVLAAVVIAVALLGFWLHKERTQEQPAQSAPQQPQQDGYGSMKIPPQQ